MFADIDFFYVSSFILKENHILIEENNPSEKNCYSQRIIRWYRDDIGNLEDLLVLINEEFGNPKVVVDVGELTRNINQKKKPSVLQACRYSLVDKCFWQEYFFKKHLEYCDSAG